MAGGSIYNDFKKSTVIRRCALPVHAPTSSSHRLSHLSISLLRSTSTVLVDDRCIRVEYHIA
jgi:hypothetical protein